MTAVDDPVLVQAFTRAVAERGGAYAILRAEILARAGAGPFLRRRIADATAWQERLTSEMLLAWIEHKPACDEAFRWLKDKERRKTRTAIGKTKPEESARHIVALGSAIVPWVIEAWLKTVEPEDFWEEAVLVESLAQLRDTRSVEPVVAVFENRAEVEPRRTSAAYVLKHLGDMRARPVLERALRDTTESDTIRKAAAGALATLQPVGARPAIEDVMRSSATSSQLKSDLAFELANLGEPASRAALEQELEASDDALVLQGVTFALGRVGDASTVELLRAKKQRDIDREARESCEDAIREIELQMELSARAEPDGGAQH